MLRVFRHYIPHLPLILFFGDLIVLVAAFHVPWLTGTWIAEGALIPKLLLVILLVGFVLNLGGLYDVRLAMGHRELLARLLTCQTVAGLLVAAVAFALPSLRLGRAAFLQIGAAATLGLIAWRAAWIGPFTHRRIRIRVLVLGTGAIGKVIAGLVETGARPFSIVGFLDDNPNAPETVPEPYALLGKIQDLPALVEETRPDLIVVAQMNRRGNFPAKALIDCRMRGIQVEDWPTFYEKETGKILVTDLRPSWLIFSDGFVKTPRTEIVKRLVDVGLSLTGLMLALPVMAVVALAIKMESRGPALFRQPRLGQNGRVFILNKFRSMCEDAEKDTGPVWAQQRDPRVTRVGAFLRKTRLDELPQLFNVLKGEMNIVGPRPERPTIFAELTQNIAEYRLRQRAKPGITGLAQINQHYDECLDDVRKKVQYDLEYIQQQGLLEDFKIMLKTIPVVLLRRGGW
jgi:sugar transferase (PEP-CTERM system associated)